MSHLTITQILGDYEVFFSGLLHGLTALQIDITGMPLSHVCCRVSSIPEYEIVRDQLMEFSKSYVEHDLNGRPIAVYILKSPLILAEDHMVSVIELLPPKSGKSYTRGLEHCGIMVGKRLPQFHERHIRVLTGQKQRGPHCQFSFVTFNNGTTVKFYDRSLIEIAEADGWEFSRIG